VPLAGELTASLINRAADRYGLPEAGVPGLWTRRNSPARHDGGTVRADAELVLNTAGRKVFGLGEQSVQRLALRTIMVRSVRGCWRVLVLAAGLALCRDSRGALAAVEGLAAGEELAVDARGGC
jgi:hypothetical protein